MELCPFKEVSSYTGVNDEVEPTHPIPNTVYRWMLGPVVPETPEAKRPSGSQVQKGSSCIVLDSDSGADSDMELSGSSLFKDK